MTHTTEKLEARFEAAHRDDYPFGDTEDLIDDLLTALKASEQRNAELVDADVKYTLHQKTIIIYQRIMIIGLMVVMLVAHKSAEGS